MRRLAIGEVNSLATGLTRAVDNEDDPKTFH